MVSDKNSVSHQNILEVNNEFFNEDESKEIYVRNKNDPRLISFYLPQFYPIPENDKSWGKGFTEWTNVRKAEPRFVGHQQPFLPLNDDYYDLRDPNVLEQQIRLAKQYGIFGFCFYHYWFSGKRLLDVPLDIFLQNKQWDFGFMICWANENWTKRWDGREEEIIIAQKYRDNDPLEFIKSVEHIIIDPRYIRNNNKPVLMVYRAPDLRDPLAYSNIWRKYLRDKYSIEIELVTTIGFDLVDPRSYGFDKALDFEPLTYGLKKSGNDGSQVISRKVSRKLIDKEFTGNVEDYRNIALDDKQYEVFNFPNYKAIMPSWDNDARRKGKGFTMHNSTPDVYAHWLKNTIKIETSNNKQEPLIFINAWNEWGEGAVLEPTKHFGYANLLRTAEILSQYNKSKRNLDNFPLYRIRRGGDSKLAVVIHLEGGLNWDVLNEKLGYLKNIKHDLFFYISKDLDISESYIQQLYPNSNIYYFSPNEYIMMRLMHVGRRLLECGYDNLLNIASSQSINLDKGIEDILPSKQQAFKAYKTLQNHSNSAIGVTEHSSPLTNTVVKDNPKIKEVLSNIYNPTLADIILEETFGFGKYKNYSFWVNLPTISQLLNFYFLPYDFLNPTEGTPDALNDALWNVFWMLPKLRGGSIYSIGKGDIMTEKFEVM